MVWQYFTKVEVKEKGAIVRKVRWIVCRAVFADSSTNIDGSTGKISAAPYVTYCKNSAASRQSVLDIGQLLKGRPNKALAVPMSSDVTAIVEAKIAFTEVESLCAVLCLNRHRQQQPEFLQLYTSQKAELKAELATTAIAVSISIDVWKSATFAIIAHWITEEWKAHEAVFTYY
ncbi:hypothetical protein V1522DRAFT_130643 [Lipomyces starkeyi]